MGSFISPIIKRSKILVAALSQELKRCSSRGRLGPLEEAGLHHAALSHRRSDRIEKKQNTTPLNWHCGTVYHVCVQWRTESEEEALWRCLLSYQLVPRNSHKWVWDIHNDCVLARVHSSLQQEIFTNSSKLDSAPTIHHQTAANWTSNETSIQTFLLLLSTNLILGICN